MAVVKVKNSKYYSSVNRYRGQRKLKHSIDKDCVKIVETTVKESADDIDNVVEICDNYYPDKSNDSDGLDYNNSDVDRTNNDLVSEESESNKSLVSEKSELSESEESEVSEEYDEVLEESIKILKTININNCDEDKFLKSFSSSYAFIPDFDISIEALKHLQTRDIELEGQQINSIDSKIGLVILLIYIIIYQLFINILFLNRTIKRLG
jgi:hypothetical protein